MIASASALLLLLSAVPVPAQSTTSLQHLFPKYHLRPAKNWINDPCGPYFDQETKEYHLFYQYNGLKPDWGNITWGHFTSKDLAHWQDRGIAVNPGPNDYDKLHVFSGSALAKGYKDLPTIFYTAVNYEPINWRLPFVRGAEKQALAYTPDHGQTWIKVDQNPLLSGDNAPKGNLTGWRDPFVFQSPTIDNILKSPQPNHYMIVSGGWQQQTPKQPTEGPAIFLYKSTDLLKWTDASIPFFHTSPNQTYVSLPVEKSGSFGFNFELTNFETLTDDWGNDWHVLVTGTEGGRAEFDLKWPIWVVGDIVGEEGKAVLKPKLQGVGDWGWYYAQNGFVDPNSKKWIVWGWSNEDDGVAKTGRDVRGWAGVLSVPREQFIKTMQVSETVAKEAAKTGMWLPQQNPQDLSKWRVATLGVRPADELNKLRIKSLHSAVGEAPRSGKLDGKDLRGTSLDINAKFSMIAKDSKIGFTIFKSSTGDEQTHIYYDASTSKITVDRSKSSLLDVPKAMMTGHFELLPNEPLELRLLVDKSIVEVFANDRFAMTVRLYPTKADSDMVGWFVEGGGKMKADVEVWEVAAASDVNGGDGQSPVMSAASTRFGGMGVWASAARLLKRLFLM